MGFMLLRPGPSKGFMDRPQNFTGAARRSQLTLRKSSLSLARGRAVLASSERALADSESKKSG